MAKLTKEQIQERLKGMSDEERGWLKEALGVSGDGDLMDTIRTMQAELADLKTKVGSPPKPAKSFLDRLFGDE